MNSPRAQTLSRPCYQAAAPGPVVGVLPVRQARERRRQTPDDADAHACPRRLPGPDGATLQQLDTVEDDGRAPGPEWNVVQDRVQRLTQPGAVQGIADLLGAAAEQVEPEPEHVLDSVAGRVQPFLTFNCSHRAFRAAPG